MPELFEVQTPTDAWRKLGNLFRPVVSAERVAVAGALGRVLAQDLTAPHDLPSFRRSTVDGYAVAAQDTYGASASLPAYMDVVGEVPMGRAATISLDEGQCVLVHTGGMIPPDADAVVMVEHTQVIGKGTGNRERPAANGGQDAGQIEVLRSVAVGQNVIQIGEDVRRGDPVLPAGHQMRPQDIGGLLALGIVEVKVAIPPRVAILSQGDEVVPPDQEPGPGQIRDINSYTLAALVRQAGGVPLTYPIVPDRLEALQAAARTALAEADLLVMSAGSSVSFRDLTAQVIQGLGQPGILVHGVSVKPGKPTIIALCERKPVFGLPGNPVSAMVVFDLFVTPAIRRLLGVASQDQEGDLARTLRKTTVRARLARNVASTTGREDFIPVRLETRSTPPPPQPQAQPPPQRPQPDLWAVPVFGKSNLIYTLIHAVGTVKVPLDSNGIAEGEWVAVELY